MSKHVHNEITGDDSGAVVQAARVTGVVTVNTPTQSTETRTVNQTGDAATYTKGERSGGIVQRF